MIKAIFYQEISSFYLFIPTVAVYDLDHDLNDIKYNIQYLTLNSNSSTLAELETVKNILSDTISNGKHIIYLYTDCNRIVKLYEKTSINRFA